MEQPILHADIRFRGTTLTIPYTTESTIGEIKQKLHEQTSIPIDYMKLMVKGRLLSIDKDILSDIWKGPKEGKIVMTGSLPDELMPATPPKDLGRVKDDLTRRNKRQNHKVQVSSSASSRHRFLRTEALSGFHDKSKAEEILHSLATDPAILKVLEKHKWTVGALCEMFPEGYVGVSDVCVMGLNQNHGEKILLRLRTDDLKGFRKILSVRKVLFHELAHNVYSDHDDNFYQLMRRIEREVNEADWTTNQRGRVLDKHYDRYKGDSSGSRAEDSQTVWRLGGDEGVSQTLPPRQAAGLAAVLRLSKEETEIETGCGCSHPTFSTEDLNISKEGSISTPDNIHLSVASSNGVPVETQGPAAQDDVKAQDGIAKSSSTLKLASPHSDFYSYIPLKEFKSEFLDASSSVINNAVSFEQSDLIEPLQNLRDSLITTLSSFTSPSLGSLEAIETLKLVLMIVNNASGDSHEKYRRLKKTGITFNRVIILRNATPIIGAIGFSALENRDGVEYYVLPDDKYNNWLLFFASEMVSELIRIIE